MKILGVFSFMFGIGLLILAGFGFTEEIRHSTFIGKIILCALLISGSSIILFVVRTFSKNKISNEITVSEDILDIPEHILAEESSRALPPFILGCGYVSLIVSAIAILYCVYVTYTFVVMLSMFGGSTFGWLFIILGLFFTGAIMLLIYCIRKLFFSRK